MITYESTFICSPELPTEKIEELVEKSKKIVETAGGKVIVVQQLGRKRLAYPIKKFREGSYVYLELSGPGEMITTLENFYKVSDPIIRYLTVKVEKKKVVRPAAAAPAAAAGTPAAAPAPAVTEEGKSNEPANNAPAS